MRGTTVDPQLRRELQRITDEYIGDRAHEQIALVRALSERYPHSISVVAEAVWSRPESIEFTCFQFALDLVPLPNPVRRIAVRFPEVFVSSHFVAWLATNVLEPTDLSGSTDGDLVLYRSAAKVEHAAKRSDDLTVSKWGLGHMWRHGLLEVPESFGNDVSWFRALPGDAARDAFIQYAKIRLGTMSQRPC